MVLDLLLSYTLIVLQVGDILTTNRLLSQGGLELNPVMRLAQRALGKYWWVVKCLLVGFFLAGVWTYRFDLTWLGHAVLVLLVLVYTWVVWNNWRQLSLS